MSVVRMPTGQRVAWWRTVECGISGTDLVSRVRVAVGGSRQQCQGKAVGAIVSVSNKSQWDLSSDLQAQKMADPFPLRGRAIHSVEAAEMSTQPSSETLELWRTADAVCFDVDSTVSVDEGIDQLAAFCGAGEAVAAWTARAMGGSVSFEESLAARLALFKPSSETVADFLSKKPPRLTPGIENLISKLHSSGVDVYLVSGGFHQMIEPIAAILNIPKERIFANRLLFHPDGELSGVDLNEPTCRSGGKAEALAKIKQTHGYTKLVMIGDGATDLEARRPGGADIFICYGGVQLRQPVAAKADWLVTSFDDLIRHVCSA